MLTLSITVCHDGTETLLILSRSDERANHRMLFGNVSQWRAVYLTQPEQESSHVRIAPQVTKILRRHKGAVVLGIDEGAFIDRIGLRVVVRQSVDYCAASSIAAAGLREQIY